MMHCLLDTHLLLWLLYRPSRLPASFLPLLKSPEVSWYFSVVSFIEVAIKMKTGKLEFSVDLDAMQRKLLENGLAELQLQFPHSLALAELPLVHRDPFDRLLLAQAKAEGLLLLTVDKRLVEYGSIVELLR